MVRVKLTGEECSVDEQTFRLLRNEEKRLRRSKAGITAPERLFGRSTLLSTDYISLDSSDDDMQASWLIDPVSLEDSVTSQVSVHEFVDSLTDFQKEVYEQCLLGKESLILFAAKRGIEYQSVQKCIARIRKKAKNFFGRGCDLRFFCPL